MSKGGGTKKPTNPMSSATKSNMVSGVAGTIGHMGESVEMKAEATKLRTKADQMEKAGDKPGATDLRTQAAQLDKQSAIAGKDALTKGIGTGVAAKIPVAGAVYGMVMDNEMVKGITDKVATKFNDVAGPAANKVIGGADSMTGGMLAKGAGAGGKVAKVGGNTVSDVSSGNIDGLQHLQELNTARTTAKNSAATTTAATTTAATTASASPPPSTPSPTQASGGGMNLGGMTDMLKSSTAGASGPGPAAGSSSPASGMGDVSKLVGTVAKPSAGGSGGASSLTSSLTGAVGAGKGTGKGQGLTSLIGSATQKVGDAKGMEGLTKMTSGSGGSGQDAVKSMISAKTVDSITKSADQKTAAQTTAAHTTADQKTANQTTAANKKPLDTKPPRP